MKNFSCAFCPALSKKEATALFYAFLLAEHYNKNLGTAVMEKWEPRFLLFLIMASVSMGSGIALLFFSSASWQKEPIKNIKVRGQSYLKKNEIFQRLKWKKGKTFPAHDLKKMHSRLLADPIILSASFNQEGPTLYVDIVERECIALLEKKEKKQIYDIDTEGRILSRKGSRCMGVPLIRGSFEIDGSYFRGKNINRVIQVLVKIKKAYPALLKRFSEVRLNGEGSLSFFLLHSYSRVDIGLDADTMMLRRLYASVAYLLSKKIKRGWVDLRGSEAVLYTRL